MNMETEIKDETKEPNPLLLELASVTHETVGKKKEESCRYLKLLELWPPPGRPCKPVPQDEIGTSVMSVSAALKPESGTNSSINDKDETCDGCDEEMQLSDHNYCGPHDVKPSLGKPLEDIHRDYLQDDKLWTTPNIRLLIAERLKMERHFRKGTKNRNSLWLAVTKTINNTANMNVTCMQSQRKFSNLKTTYMRNLEKKRKTGRQSITWEFFEAFDEVFGKVCDMTPTVTPDSPTVSRDHLKWMQNGLAAPSTSSTSLPPKLELGSENEEEPTRRRKRKLAKRSWIRQFLQDDKEADDEWREKLLRIEERKVEALETITRTVETLIGKLCADGSR